MGQSLTPDGESREVAIHATNLFRKQSGERQMTGHQADLLMHYTQPSATYALVRGRSSSPPSLPRGDHRPDLRPLAAPARPDGSIRSTESGWQSGDTPGEADLYL